MAKNQKKRQRPNYFQSQVNLYGEDFLSRKTPIDIQKDAKKIFSDLSYGNIDIERDAKYFTYVNFLLNLKTVAYDNYKYHAFTLNGMKQIINQAQTNQIEEYFIRVSEMHERCMGAYSLIIFYIDSMLSNKGVTINLTALVKELQHFRGAFSEIMIVRSDYQRRREKEVF